MQDWTDIRQAVLVQGASKRAVCRRYGIAHKTLQKILAWSEPPGYRLSSPRPKTKLGPYVEVIEEILAADREAPAKQRHTAKRIFERLRDEHGYGGGITQVKVAVARLRRHASEVYVPLAHSPGRAQFDFGEAAVQIAGKRCKAHFAVMSLPYSDAFFMRAYPRECTETFQDAGAHRLLRQLPRLLGRAAKRRHGFLCGRDVRRAAGPLCGADRGGGLSPSRRRHCAARLLRSALDLYDGCDLQRHPHHDGRPRRQDKEGEQLRPLRS